MTLCLGRSSSAARELTPPARTSKLARRVASDLRAAGWQLKRVLSDNGGGTRSPPISRDAGPVGSSPSSHPRGTPADKRRRRSATQAMLEECWRPSFARYLHVRFTGLRRPTWTEWLRYCNLESTTQGPPHPRPHPRRDRLRCPQGEDEMSRECRHISVTVQIRSSPPSSPLATERARGAGPPRRRSSGSRAALRSASPSGLLHSAVK